VIVVAEGAEDGLLEEEKKLVREQMGMKDGEVVRDESGNIKNVDIGEFIKSDLGKYAT
jgi:hypothetical protein